MKEPHVSDLGTAIPNTRDATKAIEAARMVIVASRNPSVNHALQTIPGGFLRLVHELSHALDEMDGKDDASK